jgi:hypothetical protein
VKPWWASISLALIFHLSAPVSTIQRILKTFIFYHINVKKIWSSVLSGKSQIWDSKIWSRVPRDSDPRKSALARASSTYKRQTRPLVREGAPQEQDRNCHANNEDLVVSPRWVFYSKRDWPADRRS